MSEPVSVIRTVDRTLINSVLLAPGIFEVISDGEAVDVPIDDKHVYLAGYVNDEVIGLVILHPITLDDVDGLEGHFQVLPQYRKAHALAFAQAVLQHITLPIFGIVPKKYQNVIAFNQRAGATLIKEINDNGEPAVIQRFN